MVVQVSLLEMMRQTKMHHPNVISIFRTLQEQGSLWLVMPYHPSDLSMVISQNSATESQKLAITEGVPISSTHLLLNPHTPSLLILTLASFTASESSPSQAGSPSIRERVERL